MNKDEAIGQNMEQQLTLTMSLLKLLLKKNVFTAEEFNDEILRSISELDQELAKLTKPHGMYTIAELGDGTYQRRCRIQDGVETATNATKEDAVRDLIRDAKWLNWADITEEDIHFEPHIPHSRGYGPGI